MHRKTPYDVIKRRYVTEKARVLEGLASNKSNPSVRKCDTPKYVFIVDKRATKRDIAEAIEEIYANVNVIAVNTITTKPKERRVRGRLGMRSGLKKAIVTLKAGDTIEEKV
ncbi:MAG: 50S ribosomal protein L23 [Verrucomicrobia bacterium]|nr:50S ribosomal protein L23 [Verrucomicrobiota bacterium]